MSQTAATGSDRIDLGTYGSVNTNDMKDAVNKYGSVAMELGKVKYLELKKYAEDGNWTWKIMGLVAGAAITALFALSFISNFFGLSPFNAILDIYMITFGLMAVMLEYKETFFSKKFLDILRKEALFLYCPYGRAAFYFFVGLLVVSLGGLLGLIVGIYTMAVGVIIFQASRSTMKHLQQLKDSSLDEQQIAAKFQQYDVNNDGCLNTTELAKLCQSLGVALSLNELESALFILDKNQDGKIQYSEFLEWFKGRDSHEV